MANYSIFDDYDKFDTDVFSYNSQPLAYYLEPEGYDSLSNGELLPNGKYKPHKRPQFITYKRLLPETAKLTEYMHNYIGGRKRWGKIFNYGWVNVIDGKDVVIKGKTIPQKAMSLADLIKSYAKKYVYARCITDIYDPQTKWDWSDPKLPVPYKEYIPIHCLRIDVDMKLVWHHNWHELLQPELIMEKLLADEFGFTYNVFTTGNKGHQIILTLPHAINHTTADFLYRIYTQCLESIKPDSHTEIDVNTLDHLLRLPLGQHHIGEGLGLFINLDKWKLYNIGNQVNICKQAFWKNNLLCAELDEVADYFMNLGIPKEQTLTPAQFSAAINDLTDNPYVHIYHKYLTKNTVMLIESDHTEVEVEEDHPEVEVDIDVEEYHPEVEVEQNEPECQHNIKQSTADFYAILMSEPIPLTMSHEYSTNYGVYIFKVMGEEALVKWFTMSSDEIDDSKVAERLKYIKYQIRILKKKDASGELYTPKPAFNPLAIQETDKLIAEIQEVIQSHTFKNSRFNIPKLTQLIIYMIKCSKFNNGGRFFRSYGNILDDCKGIYADKKAICNALGLFVDGLLTDKKGINKPNFGIFTLVERSQRITGGNATEYCIKSDYSYLLDLLDSL